MIGIQAIASYIPGSTESNLDKLDLFAISETFIHEKIGVINKRQKPHDEDTSDMCVKAYRNLEAKVPGIGQELDCMAICTQNPDGHGLPHASAILHGKLGLKENIAAFDISLGCSGFVYGLSLLTSFMEANGMNNGILFTADPYSKVVDRTDKDTSLLFGDAAAATLLSRSPVFTIERSVFATRGKDHHRLICNNNHLHMDGRAIFNFTATAVPLQVRNLLSLSGYHVDDIDLFIFHQGSKFIVDTITKRLNIDRKRVPSNLENLGNTVSSSIPILFEQYLDQYQYRLVVISGFGVGLSWATSILNRN